MMGLIIWIISVFGIGVSFTAFLFTILQYTNKKGRSKTIIIRRSIVIGVVFTTILFIIGYSQTDIRKSSEIIKTQLKENKERSREGVILDYELLSFDDSQLSSLIMNLLHRDLIDSALLLSRYIKDSTLREVEEIHICNYYITKGQISKADSIANALKYSSDKDSLKIIIENEKLKLKKSL
jgi:hypothetical protein